MSTALLFVVSYLVLGMVTTTALWIGMQEEIEMAISLDLDDEGDRPAFRSLLTLVFLFGWPIVIWDVVRNQ